MDALIARIADLARDDLAARRPPSVDELRLLTRLCEGDVARTQALSPYAIISEVSPLDGEIESVADVAHDEHARDGAIWGSTERVVALERLEREDELVLVASELALVCPSDADACALPTPWDQEPMARRRAPGWKRSAPLEKVTAMSVGLRAFVGALDLSLAMPHWGCKPTHELVWAPDSVGDGLVARAPGRYALRRLGSQESLDWRKVPDDVVVFALGEPSDDDIATSNFFLGAGPAAGETVALLRRYAYAAHDHDEDGECECEDFGDSLDALIRARYLDEPAIAPLTALEDVRQALAAALDVPPERIDSLRPPSQGERAITVTLTDGAQRTVRLY